MKFYNTYCFVYEIVHDINRKNRYLVEMLMLMILLRVQTFCYLGFLHILFCVVTYFHKVALLFSLSYIHIGVRYIVLDSLPLYYYSSIRLSEDKNIVALSSIYYQSNREDKATSASKILSVLNRGKRYFVYGQTLVL